PSGYQPAELPDCSTPQQTDDYGHLLRFLQGRDHEQGHSSPATIKVRYTGSQIERRRKVGELEKERRPSGRSWATGLPGAAWVACALLLSGTPLGVLAGDDAQGRIEAGFQHHRSLRLQFPQPMQTWENRVDPQAIRLTPALPVQCTWTSDTLID